MKARPWAVGALLATLAGGGLYGAGLELWSSPEPCKPMRIRVGEVSTYCPHPMHETRETWSDDWAVEHLECLCP